MTSPSKPPATKVLSNEDGSAVVVAGANYTEKEVVEDRDAIVQRLHGAYLNLLDEMREFQQQWDANPERAFMDAAYEGIKAGGGEWADSVGDMFDAKTWSEVGAKVKNFAGKAYDTMADYAAQGYQELSEALGDAEKQGDALLTWAWWQTTINMQAERVYDHGRQQLDAAVKSAHRTVEAAIVAADRAHKLYQYRNEILNLPNLIAEGDVKGVQSFVDTVLMQIDPDTAKAIKEDKNFPVVIELIADHESALEFVAYLSLTIEAVPPNFYAYISAKFGVQLLLEVVLTIVCAFLSAGAAVAARLTALAARLAASSAKVAGAVRKIKRAQQALRAFTRVLDDFNDAINELHRLGEKLVSVRARGVTIKGRTKQTLKAKKQTVKRDTRCRLCGSTQHTTPRGRLGMVVYD